MEELKFLDSYETIEQLAAKLEDVHERLDESISPPTSPNNQAKKEFIWVLHFMKGLDAFFEEDWSQQRLEELRAKRGLSMDEGIQHLRHLKGLSPLSEEDLKFLMLPYSLVIFYEKSKTNAAPELRFYQSDQITIESFLDKVIRPFAIGEPDWRLVSQSIILLVKAFIGANDQRENFSKLREAVQPKANRYGWDMPTNVFQLIPAKIDQLRHHYSKSEFLHKLKQEPKNAMTIQRRDFMNFNEEIEKQEYPELQSDKSNTSEEPESLNAPATAIIIRAINKVEPGSIDVSFDGVIKGVENFNIPYKGSGKNLYNYTQAGGSDKDPNRDGPLRAAEKWLAKHGYAEARDIVKRWITED